MLCDHMIKWISGKTSKLGFGIVIRRSDSSFDRRQPFVVTNSERSGEYKELLQKLKCGQHWIKEMRILF